MSELQFNLKDESGTQRFITPRIVITANGKDNHVPANIALQVAYVVKAVVDGNTSAFGDKTKGQAGQAILKAVTALPKDAKVTLYMPKASADRENPDLSKWAKVVTVSHEDMVNASNALAKCAGIMAQAEKQVEEVVNSVKLGTYDFSQPVYFAGQAVAKTRGGKKEIETLF